MRPTVVVEVTGTDKQGRPVGLYSATMHGDVVEVDHREDGATALLVDGHERAVLYPHPSEVESAEEE